MSETLIVVVNACGVANSEAQRGSTILSRLCRNDLSAAAYAGTDHNRKSRILALSRNGLM